MKVENFLYWLQGAIELFENNEDFDYEQTHIIGQHLKLVYEFDKDLGKSPGSPFIFWLTGFLERGSEQVNLGINRKDYRVVKVKLSKIFLHEIAPLAGDKNMQDKLNEIHNVKTNKEMTLEEAIEKFGPQPYLNAKFNIHGWEDPDLGLMRC